MIRAAAVTLLFSSVLLNPARSNASDATVLLARKDLAEAAERQSLTPVRPGVPGEQPFWNGRARKFIYAPAFDFAAVEGATSYRFTARSGADLEAYTFTAEHPWADLGPIWQQVPVGMVELTVDAMKGDAILKTAGVRRFHKDSPFKGPYRAAVVDYRQSAHKLIEYSFRQPFIQYWLEKGKPDPKFSLYSYPSKVIGAVVEVMTLAMQENLPFKEDARTIAEKAATFLIQTSLPADSTYAYFPLTYDLTQVKSPSGAAKMYGSQLMTFYPAEVGLQYLGLYRITKDPALLEAAKRIADTYVRTQLPAGTWPIKVTIADGKPAGDHLCVPVHIIRFLHEMITAYGMKEYEKPCQAAFDWTMNNPVRTFDWSGQFEDVKQEGPPYANLSARAAALFLVIYLQENYAGDPGKMAVARELLRFSEDQFTVWERPAPSLQFDFFDLKPGHARLGDRKIGDTSTWITPVTLEQYGYYVPIGTSGAVTLQAWLSAWKTGHDELDLAKAVSFANNMTYIQLLHGDGGLPTHWAITHHGTGGWINNLSAQSRALLDMADALKNTQVVVAEELLNGCAHTAAGEPCPYAGTATPCPYTRTGLVKTSASKPAKP